MGAIAFQDMALLTVTYNGVQFGGNDTDYKSFPPEYSLNGDFVYDESGRAVIKVRYRMRVSTIFYENTEETMANNFEAIRELLSVPGKELSILGLGTGFDEISYDVGFGPKPISFDFQPLGQIAWQCVWVVEFHVSECALLEQSPDLWLAFNFETTWANDFEGMCERTMSGHVLIVPRRTGLNGKSMLMTADFVRDRLNIAVPDHFARVYHTWRENSAKDRIDFSIIDSAERGTPLPEGCIQADGDLTYSSHGPGFEKSSVTMTMRLRISPSFPPGLAGVIFLAAAKTKQQRMQAINNDNRATIVPRGINIVNGKFGRSRETSASITWDLTKCVGSMMKAAGIWEPIPKGNNDEFTYPLWRASISNLWNNRGIHGLRSNVDEAAIIDLCDRVTGATIGVTPSNHQHQNQQPEFLFSCPDIPEDGGWIGHDIRLRVMRIDDQTWHKKALAFLSGPFQAVTDSLADRTGLGGFLYQQNGDAEEHDVEYHGYPVQYVVLEFRGLRLVRKPIMPELIKIDGLTPVFWKGNIDGPRPAFDAMNCKVWFMRGYKIYKVNGPVSSVKHVLSKTSCAMDDANANNQYEQ